MELGFHRLADLFPLVEGAEFAALVDDIKGNGLREAIWLYERQILDGRNRYRACIEAGVVPAFRQYEGDDPLAFVVSLNLARRHMNAGQLAMVALKIEEVEAEYAAARKKATQFGSTVIANLRQPAEGKASEKAASAVGVSPRQVQKAKKVKVARPDLAKKVETGEISLHAADRQMAEDEKAEDLARPVSMSLPAGIYHGDFRELSAEIPDNSVDLIFTDPPYDADAVPLYEDAARVAARILKPGGSFISYSGQRFLPDVYAGVGKHLRYWWTCAAVHEGGNQIMQKLGIRCGWKPIVWYVKDTRGDIQNVIVDAVRGDREKFAHEWQQAQNEAEHFIEKLCAADGLVVDFFLGGGTTAAATKRLGRRFIGFEINAASVEKSVARFVDEQRKAA